MTNNDLVGRLVEIDHQNSYPFGKKQYIVVAVEYVRKMSDFEEAYISVSDLVLLPKDGVGGVRRIPLMEAQFVLWQ